MQLHFCTFLYKCNDLCFIYFWTKLLTDLRFGISIQSFLMDKGLRESLILTRISILEAFVHWTPPSIPFANRIGRSLCPILVSVDYIVSYDLCSFIVFHVRGQLEESSSRQDCDYVFTFDIHWMAKPFPSTSDSPLVTHSQMLVL